MELGIRNAITQETKLKIVGCWRHLRKDIEAWVGKHGGAATDKNVYVDNVYDLLRSENEANYLDSLAEKKKIWSKAFVEYYDQHISKWIRYYASWCIPDSVQLTSSGVTTNMSEGFNWLVKYLNGWTEKPTDAIVLCFCLLQDFHEQEINRGHAAIGTYTLKQGKKQTPIENLTVKPTIPPRDIVKSVKEK